MEEKETIEESELISQTKIMSDTYIETIKIMSNVIWKQHISNKVFSVVVIVAILIFILTVYLK